MRCAALFLALMLAALQAAAWGPRGHQTSVAIAEALIAGSRAERELRALLQPAGWTLADAAQRPDCLRGVGRPSSGPPECRVFSADDLAAAVAGFEGACGPRIPPEACHRRLHYTDVAIQREAWRPGLAGTREADIVGALGAAIAVLQDQPPPGPPRFASKREALAWLAHLVGDLHQPLHVGALYLDAGGQPIDPDHTPHGPTHDTAGGNRLQLGERNLHSLWDAAPPISVNAALLAEARALPRPSGAAAGWPAQWASETLGVARQALSPLRFSPARGDPPQWTQRSPDDAATREALQRRQLLRAGARLAQLLQAIWP
ncbi:S1/P1 nuclease [Ideonella sp. 4Y11]|uniref:S1/P1 nuclease n=1 Tax=Ideonella aquatica TaxID=2824119 RepID=A0A940YI73_9BURK|nr:S1/P1 nuclease [Ideonella aquatica]MBQ0958566.1 S1/P1 nuclease [Ideonella aquatica]